ncbi:LacI family DNA-binding transcriptional regulator [Aurantiacibacter gangjinensis]|uniref:LacI family transcriptional regulator n=1 Tax=Aurantiacibacter gangjinensis TaxID=502682 RepID=A0A0G9MRJ8_9SPHN|nr:LacI family DNA-binding transcriptional regulator [Aurantiacibacter gangjinensis]APE26864.1 Transcriptional regulator of maltose utilization, LacI family [Aurantiacibacter gangjinensis]KLE33335.1 LacI family transcriptional regulator [Aurantiacibacter gangjinensis]
MGRAPTGRPTSFDIAYLAGVSQPTVSRALRGDRSVSEKTRARIQQIARDLNYTVDKNASSLRSQRSNTIALLFFEDPTPDESMINPFFLSMLGSITRACANRGLDLLISFQRQEDDWHAQYQDSHRADGLILLGYGGYSSYRKKLEQLEAQGTHYARWGSVSRDLHGPTVGSDNVDAGRQVGDHLLSLGRRNIAFLGEIGEDCPELDGRYRGLLQAMAEAGLSIESVLQSDAITTEEAGYAAMQRLLADGASFDAIFAASDLIAMGAMRALAEAGRSVPGDVAVVGFDDIPAASLTNPPLTTISQDIKSAGERLVETLLAQVEGRDRPDNRLPAKLIVRASSGG